MYVLSVRCQELLDAAIEMESEWPGNVRIGETLFKENPALIRLQKAIAAFDEENAG